MANQIVIFVARLIYTITGCVLIFGDRKIPKTFKHLVGRLGGSVQESHLEFFSPIVR